MRRNGYRPPSARVQGGGRTSPEARRLQRLQAEVKVRQEVEKKLRRSERAERQAAKVAAYLTGLLGIIGFPESGFQAEENGQGEDLGIGLFNRNGSSRSRTASSASEAASASSERQAQIATPLQQAPVEVIDTNDPSPLPAPEAIETTTPTGTGGNEQQPSSGSENGTDKTNASSVSAGSARRRTQHYPEEIFLTTDACSFIVILAILANFIILPFLVPAVQAQHFAPDIVGRHPRSPMTLDATMFRAYDCTVPDNVTSTSFYLRDSQQACEGDVQAVEETPTEYLLLQKSRRLEIEVKECRMVTSRLAFSCARSPADWMYNHFAPRECYFNLPTEVTSDECREYWKTKTFPRPSWDAQQIKDKKLKNAPAVNLTMERTNYFTWARTGATWNNYYMVHCVGGYFDYNKMRDMHLDDQLQKKKFSKVKSHPDMGRMVVSDDVQLSMFTRKAYITLEEDGSLGPIMVDHNQLILPCDVNSLNCSTTTGTYFWDLPAYPERCPYFQVRQTTGVHVTDPEDHTETTFLADEDALVRLRKKGVPQIACGGMIEATEFNRLFLTKDIDNKYFKRPLPAVEASQFLYSEVADLYVYEKVQDDLARAVKEVQRQRCKEAQGKDVVAYAQKLAETKAVADGDTAHLGKGIFVTAAGDGGYIYRCRPITVKANPEKGKCFNALPVELATPDLETYRRAMQKPEDQYQFYLEPKTHRLITTAAPNLCLESLPAIYQNLYGTWMAQSSTGLRPVSTPESIASSLKHQTSTYARGRLDLDGKGLYDAATVKEIEIFLQARRASEAIPWEMERTYRQKHEQRLFDAGRNWGGISDFYYDVPGTETFTAFRNLQWFWDFLEKYGQLCSIVITTAILWRFVAWLARVAMRLCAVPEVDNYLLHIANAFFPEWTEPCMRRNRRRRRRGAHFAELQECFCNDAASESSEQDEYRPKETEARPSAPVEIGTENLHRAAASGLQASRASETSHLYSNVQASVDRAKREITRPLVHEFVPEEERR